MWHYTNVPPETYGGRKEEKSRDKPRLYPISLDIRTPPASQLLRTAPGDEEVQLRPMSLIKTVRCDDAM